MNQPPPLSYPFSEFQNDLDACNAINPLGLRSPQESAKLILSVRYPTNPTFSYRFNRLCYICYILSEDREKILQDMLAIKDEKGDERVENAMLEAIHEWCMTLDESVIRRKPVADWPTILEIRDRLLNEEEA